MRRKVFHIYSFIVCFFHIVKKKVEAVVAGRTISPPCTIILMQTDAGEEFTRLKLDNMSTK